MKLKRALKFFAYLIGVPIAFLAVLAFVHYPSYYAVAYALGWASGFFPPLTVAIIGVAAYLYIRCEG